MRGTEEEGLLGNGAVFQLHNDGDCERLAGPKQDRREPKTMGSPPFLAALLGSFAPVVVRCLQAELRARTREVAVSFSLLEDASSVQCGRTVSPVWWVARLPQMRQFPTRELRQFYGMRRLVLCTMNGESQKNVLIPTI